MKKKEKFAKPFENPKTLAAGKRVPLAVGDFIIYDIFSKSKGTAIRINDEEMLEGVSLLASKKGGFFAPEGGLFVMASKKNLKENNFIKDTDKVVLVNTGSAYKYLDMMEKRFWGD
ncbi:MAG: hypothetical protein Ct9H90mP2_03060 [Dehalococcoidia bacterium]|nr:MAG: hypothetical protein Ct9H90mP2_03060 [Dehalococcoidia bacterium]